MAVKTSNTAVQQIVAELASANPFDYTASKEVMNVWGLSIETIHLPIQIAYEATDNRLNSRTFFKWARAGEHVNAAIDKREIKTFIGGLLSNLSEQENSVRFAPVGHTDSWLESYV